MYCMPKPAVPDPVTLSLRDRTLVVVLVVCVHVSLLWSWAALPALSRPAHHEMSVSMDMSPDMPNPVRAVEPAPAPQAKPRHVNPAAAQAEKHAAPVETSTPPAAASTAPVQPVNAAPGLPDREPDYRAAYLNNPPPAYPMAARRMGWQGRVVLNVEVLANGLPGQIAVQQSSGHEVLDNAALQAVRGWRFVAARQGGQVVSQRFLVPIPFILKEAE
jgi:protein TonB